MFTDEMRRGHDQSWKNLSYQGNKKVQEKDQAKAWRPSFSYRGPANLMGFEFLFLDIGAVTVCDHLVVRFMLVVVQLLFML